MSWIVTLKKILDKAGFISTLAVISFLPFESNKTEQQTIVTERLLTEKKYKYHKNIIQSNLLHKYASNTSIAKQ